MGVELGRDSSKRRIPEVRGRRFWYEPERVTNHACEHSTQRRLPRGGFPKQPARYVGALFGVVRKELGSFSEVFDDCVRLGEHELTVDEGRDLAGRIDRQIFGSSTLAAIDVHELDVDWQAEVVRDRERLAPVRRKRCRVER